MLARDDGPNRIIVFIAVTVASDIGGFFAGTFLGAHKMAPAISPKKTWEGFTGYYWIDRKDIPDRALAELIQHPDVQVHIAYVAGVPAGFFELDRRRGGLVEIMYLGLVPDFKGRGLGKWLLSEAIATAWSEPTGRLIVETCTLDAPKALSLYQRFGFVPYAREDKIIEVRDEA